VTVFPKRKWWADFFIWKIFDDPRRKWLCLLCQICYFISYLFFFFNLLLWPLRNSY